MRSACSRNRLSSRGKHEQYSREGRFGSAFWISVSKRWFCLRKISMNAAQKFAFTIVVRAKRWIWWKHERKIIITTFKWRHINAFPVHLSSNNSLEQCAVHAHEIVFFSREAWTVLPWRAFWIGVLNQRFKTLILPSQNKHERSLRGNAQEDTLEFSFALSGGKVKMFRLKKFRV